MLLHPEHDEIAKESDGDDGWHHGSEGAGEIEKLDEVDIDPAYFIVFVLV